MSSGEWTSSVSMATDPFIKLSCSFTLDGVRARKAFALSTIRSVEDWQSKGCVVINFFGDALSVYTDEDFNDVLKKLNP